jgi:two-component system LytT family sensor kinase
MMRTPKPTSRAWAIALAWTALALAFTPQAVLLNLGRPEPLPNWVAAARSAEIFLLWALFTPLVFAALRRWPPGGARHRRHLALHLAFGFVLVVAHLIVLILSLLPQLGHPMTLLEVVQAVAISVGATNVLMCAALYTAAFALWHLDERRRVERALVEARLATLRAQLQPHFLFNTLNALAELVHRDPPLAETLLLRLSALLRRALDDSDAATLPLGEELGFLDDYLAIQQALLGERLHIERRIDRDVLHWPVPPLLLQPLVENALRHGIAPRRAGGTLRLSAQCEGERLKLRVENDAGAAPQPGAGVGLRNTRERLAAHYGGRASLHIDDGSPERYLVILELPA